MANADATPEGGPEHALSRRAALKSVGALISAAGLARAGPVTRAIFDPSLPEKTIVKSGNVEVVVDADGIPIYYAVPSGEHVLFDRTKAISVRSKARSHNEPEIIDIIKVPTPDAPSPSTQSGSPEHPLLTQPPKDVLSTEQLRGRGVSVIQTDNVSLFVRSQAFLPSGPLESFANTGRKLVMALVNGPTISPDFIQDSRYDSVRKLLSGRGFATEQYKQDRVQALQSLVSTARSNLRSLRSAGASSDKIKAAQDNLYSFKASVYRYQNVLTPSDLAIEMAGAEANKGTQLPAGLYFMPGYYDQNTAVIFLAVGSGLSGSGEKTEFAEFFFDANGVFREKTSVSIPPRDLTPQPGRNHPSPNWFTPDEHAVRAGNLYAVHNPSTGFALRHELGHDKQYTENPSGPQFNEYDADMAAFKGIADAWGRWEQSGLLDDTGYGFVFFVRSKGYYIITKTKPGSGTQDF